MTGPTSTSSSDAGSTQGLDGVGARVRERRGSGNPGRLRRGLAVLALLGALLARLLWARRLRESAFTARLAERLVAVGTVDHRSARLWLRTDRPGPHVVEVIDPGGEVHTGRVDVGSDPLHDGTAVVRWPDDVGAADLAPATAYRFRVRRGDGVRVGEGRFHTAPRGADDAPEHFSVAIASCHEPFDESGELHGASMRLLDGLAGALDAQDTRLVLFLGDQVYTDLPRSHSLFDRWSFARVAPAGRTDVLDCTRAEVRRLLQRRYRAFWDVRGFRALQSRFATACILDDHEVCDNFGSDPRHAGPRWRSFREGALDAFHDYQALRTHDRDADRAAGFAHRLAWGPLAALVLDLRTQRVATPDRIQVIGEAQWALLERFLVEEAARPVLLLGLSVPLIHASEWLVSAASVAAVAGSAVHERWSHPAARPDRDRLVHLLHDHRRRHPNQQVVLVSGDVHVGTASELGWPDAPPVLQLVSSAVSNLEQRVVRLASAALPWMGVSLETGDGLRGRARLLEGLPGRDANPYTGLNAGVVGLRRTPAGWAVRLRLLGHDASAPGGVGVVFDSGELLQGEATWAAPAREPEDAR